MTMTSKEKAQELFNSYMIRFNSWSNYNESKMVKDCVKLCIDEILKLDCLTDEGWLNVPQEYQVQYWQEVKQELNEL